MLNTNHEIEGDYILTYLQECLHINEILMNEWHVFWGVGVNFINDNEILKAYR